MGISPRRDWLRGVRQALVTQPLTLFMLATLAMVGAAFVMEASHAHPSATPTAAKERR